MCTVPKPYPQEFRDDVVRVARQRGEGVTIKQVAKDFGISELCLTKWMTQADRDAGIKPGADREELAELRETKRRIRLLEQENEVLRRAAAYLSQANISPNDVPARPGAGRRRDPGTVMCRVLKIAASRTTAGSGSRSLPPPRRLPTAPTHCLTPTAAIPNSGTGCWRTRPATPAW